MPRHLKVARIGNSRGVRLPASTLARYNIGETVIMEEKLEGILLRPGRTGSEKLSWTDTAREMVVSDEDWSEWDSTAHEGIKDLVWAPARVSESPSPSYSAAGPRKKARSTRARKNK
jgi:antitoxin component of MazEF toxin-antitoxin module